MDEGGGLHTAARDSTGEAVPPLQARSSGHRQPTLRVTAKMTKAVLPARVAHAKQHPYIW